MNVETLDKEGWVNLLRMVSKTHCAPFLGAGACADVLPIGSQLSRKLADEHGYPFEDRTNLARVAQFIAINRSPGFVKDEIIEAFGSTRPSPNNPNEPHRVLAALPCPVYITTNYDNFMYQALVEAGKEPIQEVCPWNQYAREAETVLQQQPSFKPTPEKPVVFHLHGYAKIPESMVVTEEDYVNFLIAITEREKDLIPYYVRNAMTRMILFVGYGLVDSTFQVIFHGILRKLEAPQHSNIAIQIPPSAKDPADVERARAYLEKYFQPQKVRVHWEDVHAFAAHLRQQWEAYSSSHG